METLLSNSNALIVVILSHGLEGDLVMANDKEFHLYDLIKMFTPDELQSMATRPKIFIIQACRGNELDSGQILKRSRKFSVDSVDSACDEPLFKYPSHADICIALSSHYGHASFRNADGSWYIQDLCDVMENIDLSENHFTDVLTEVNRKVAQRVSSSKDNRIHDKKQVGSYYTTFTQKLYLTKCTRKPSVVVSKSPETLDTITILKVGLLIINVVVFFSKK